LSDIGRNVPRRAAKEKHIFEPRNVLPIFWALQYALGIFFAATWPSGGHKLKLAAAKRRHTNVREMR
jgi:hypothetical protein